MLDTWSGKCMWKVCCPFQKVDLAFEVLECASANNKSEEIEAYLNSKYSEASLVCICSYGTEV